MKGKPKATTASPAPEEPLEPRPAPPPDSESDRALRHTWRHGFRSQEAAQALELLAGLILESAREDFSWTYDTGEELGAVAEDLDSLAAYLALEAGTRGDIELDGPELELCARAKTWETRLRGLVREIRTALGEEGPQAAPDPEVVARSILEDLRALLDRVRETVGRRGVDPRSRPLRQALAGTLALLVEAESLLTYTVEEQGGEAEP